MTNRLITLLGVLCVAGVSTLHAQKTVSKANTITATATVEAIDYSARRVTLKNEKGETDMYVVDPAIKRLDSVKVGDKVKMTYYESLVFQVVKPGQKSSGASDEAALTRAKGAHARRVDRHAGKTDRDGEGRRSGRPLDYRDDRRRPDRVAADRRQEEHRGRQSRRQDRHHLYAGAADEHRDGEVGETRDDDERRFVMFAPVK